MKNEKPGGNLKSSYNLKLLDDEDDDDDDDDDDDEGKIAILTLTASFWLEVSTKYVHIRILC